MAYENLTYLSGEIKTIYKTKNDNLLIRLHLNDGRNAPEVFVTGNLVNQILNEYSVGDQISLSCNLQNSRKLINGRLMNVMTIFADDIIKADSNRVTLAGRILSITDYRIYHLVRIRTETMGRVSDVDVVVYDRCHPLLRMEVGEFAGVQAQVQTKRKTYARNGINETVYFTNIVAI